MNNKKGISDVVTTVLIVLLTIIAIAILWSFLSPLITRSGARIAQQEACLSANVEVVQCSAATGTALIKRNAGQGQINITGIKLIYTKADGSTEVKENLTNVPDELGSINYANQASFTPTSVAVAVGIADAQGATYYCSQTAAVKCK